MDNFVTCFAFTLGAEGGFTNISSDPGNWTGGAVGAGELKGTKFGISAASYPNLDIADLTEADAEAIYQRDFWLPLNGPQLSLPIGMVLFDTAVNAGLRRTTIFLQLAMGIVVDGSFGPVTLKAAQAFSDQSALAVEVLARRMDFYARLPTYATFGLGWARRVMALSKAVFSDQAL